MASHFVLLHGLGLLLVVTNNTPREMNKTLTSTAQDLNSNHRQWVVNIPDVSSEL
jgi:hypothetical protein